MEGALPFVGMVVSYAAQVGLMLAAQKAIATGMHTFSFIFYSNVLAFFILRPAAFLVHRVERLDYGGSAKLIGTLVTLVGALVVTFYKGPTIITYRLSSISPQSLDQSSHSILGGLLMLIESVIAALFVVSQALILKKYSAVLIWMLANCSITVILSLLASLILEHDLSAFSLQSKTRLLVILYSGFFGFGFRITIGAWCMKMKGPLFVVIFQPLGIVIAAIIGVLFLGDGLYFGCLLGSVVIVIGFYGVMWGMAKENKIVEANMVESSNSHLLQGNSEEHNVVLS
uniref:Serine/arginine-rich splicing factor RSZ21A n=1 Tax=Tanacetum cinerariifolium TaxID=118510 RepID=A0A6L2M923_TANCI|nr:serine/arginine-rich splicing factor RSZ21A [Tanacetum cinerariifolium]